MPITDNHPERAEYEGEQSRQLEFYRIMTEQRDIGLMIGGDSGYHSLNPVMDRFIEQCGKKLFLPGNEKNWQVEFQADTAQRRHFDLSLTSLSNGDNLIVAVEVTNTVQQKRYSSRLLKEAHQSANYDQLTGLANRAHLFQTARQILLEAKRDLARIAVFALDIDKFKLINDTFGHDTGDKVLRQVAKRLKQLCRSSDFIARLGGDEFCIIQRNVRVLDDVTSLAKKLVNELHDKIPTPTGEISLSSSVGIALFPGDGAEMETLLLHADKALYEAKKAGRNRFHMYSKKLNQQAIQKAAMITGLYSAFDKHEFHLRYQPAYEIDSGQITGMEVFVHWQPAKTPWSIHLRETGDNRDIHCEAFLPLLEQMGRGSTLFEWITQTVCEDLAQWRQLPGHENLTISINCSQHQLKTSDVTGIIEEKLYDNNLPPSAILLEIEEKIFTEKDKKIQAALKRLRSSGITLVLDGFGCSTATPLLLREWQPDCVKINMKCLRQNEVADGPQLIADLVTMARHMSGGPIHAGCVELSEQLTALSDSGCKVAQGTLFCQTMNAIDATHFLIQDRTVKLT